VIGQNVANDIRHLLAEFEKPLPVILEVPSKSQAYDPAKDLVMQRVRLLLGERD
jgi:V-type H+-transporting ATPase subunit F